MYKRQTYGYYLLVVDPEAEGGYLGAWNLSNMFNAIAGITYAGHDSTYSYFYLLASSGSLYMIGVKPSGTVYELSLLKILSTDSKYAISGQHMNQSLYYDGNTGWIYCCLSLIHISFWRQGIRCMVPRQIRAGFLMHP